MSVRYRVTAAPQASGYSEAGASYKRRALRAFFPNSNSPSSDIHDNADILRQRSRMLYMSAPVATSAINTNRTKIVGTGLTLKATVDRNVLGLSPEKAKEWQSKTEAEFRLWAENRRSCDAMGLNDFYGLQQLALKSWLMSGDVFAVVKIRDPDKLHPYGLRLHLVEADRVSTPDKLGGMLDGLGYTEGTNPNTGNKIYDGVEVDSSGMIVAYHVRNTYPHEWRNDITKWQRVEAVGATTGLPQILHIMESERPDQYRGVPLIAPIIEPLLQLRRYTESELLAALVQSFLRHGLSPIPRRTLSRLTKPAAEISAVFLWTTQRLTTPATARTSMRWGRVRLRTSARARTSSSETPIFPPQGLIRSSKRCANSWAVPLKCRMSCC